MSRARSLGYLMAGALLLCSCGGAARIAFEQTDATFTPRPGPVPRIYLAGEPVPAFAMKSVGVITVRHENIDNVRAATAEKGRQLGCFILVERTGRPLADLDRSRGHGVTIYRAHGGGSSIHAGRHPKMHSMSFDCVIRAPMTAELSLRR